MIAFAGAPFPKFQLASLIPDPNNPARVAVLWPQGGDTVLSVQPDGTYQTRPRSAIGAFESAVHTGAFLVYDQYADFGAPGIAWVIPMVDGL
jgi:hypothetical protein